LWLTVINRMTRIIYIRQEWIHQYDTPMFPPIKFSHSTASAVLLFVV
jgi:hypothetical protein